MGERRLRSVGEFPHVMRDNVRFGDMDRNGHVNNAVFATYFETSRTTLFHASDNGLRPEPGSQFVLAHLAIDFRRELHWPGEIELATGITAIGNTSLTMAQAIFDRGECAATARAIIVCIDQKTRRPAPFSAAIRAACAPLMLAPVDGAPV